MEAWESFVALAMEAEHFVVSEAIKFPVRRQTRKAAHPEFQSHGFEVDLVGARRDKLVLASVKSFFGSQGVRASDVTGQTGAKAKRYALLNNIEVQQQVIDQAGARFGYSLDQIEVRFYVGKFANPGSGSEEAEIRQWCSQRIVGGGPIKVVDVHEVALAARAVAQSKTYRDNAALVAMKVLAQAGMLTPA